MATELTHAGDATAARAPAAATVLGRLWPAWPAIAVLAFLLARLAFDQGGYFPAAFTSAGAIALLALAVLVVAPAHGRLTAHAFVAAGALAALALWAGLSRAWSPVPDAALLEMRRTILYLALFGLALVATDRAAHARALVWAVLGVVVAVVGAGLISRLQPDLVSASTDPSLAAFYRLDHPLGYWNAFGALASLGAVLAAGLAADPRAAIAPRAAAAGAATLLAVAMYLSLSRGAWLALIAGVLVLAAIAPRRGALAGTLAIVGAAVLAAILRLRGYPALVTDPDAGSGQAAQGDAFMRELLALALLAAGVQAALARAGAIPVLERNRRTLQRATLGTVAALVAIAAIAGYASRGREAESGVAKAYDDAAGWVTREWQEFLNPVAAAGAGTERLVTAKGARSDGYRVAIDAFEQRPLTGGGAGSFEVRYARERDLDVKIRDAHSLPLETLGELGAVGMALLLAFLAAVALAARRALAGKGALRPAEAAAVVAAFAVWLGHASVDWDWEMPALTGTALVLGATLFGRGRGRRRRRRTRGAAAAAG